MGSSPWFVSVRLLLSKEGGWLWAGRRLSGELIDNQGRQVTCGSASSGVPLAMW